MSLDNSPKIKSLIYCRVSSKSQTKGSGLSSQEHRCRQYAEAKDYEVCEVFTDDVTGGGDFMNRKGMVALLKYMDDHPQYRFVTVFDDLKRYSRDTEFHLRLKREMEKRGATRECLNFNFEDTPEGEFLETIVSATGTLERHQNARQTRQKTKARLEQGYWALSSCPVGYTFQKAEDSGKILVPDPVTAPIVKEGLEGFASGRFASQTELRRFFESQPDYPKNKRGKIYNAAVPRLLRKELYAGLLSCEAYGVSRRKANHEPLISIETHQRILARLDGGIYAPMRNDIDADFPLRGGVTCSSCGKPLTAGWCKGKIKKYAYYFCDKRTEDCKGVIPRDKLHSAYEDVLGSLKPSQGFLRVFKAMFKMQWEFKTEKSADLSKGFAEDANRLENQINDILTKILNLSNPRVIAAFENQIEDLERQKLLAVEKAQNAVRPRVPFEDMLKHAFSFLSNPQKLWNSGRLDLQRMTLRLAFAGPLVYDRKTASLNTKFSLPFSVLGKNFGEELKLVPRERIELSTSSLPMMRSTTELPRLI